MQTEKAVEVERNPRERTPCSRSSGPQANAPVSSCRSGQREEVMHRVPMVSLTGQMFWTGYSKDRSKTGKLEVVPPYIKVRILGPVTTLGLADRSEP